MKIDLRAKLQAVALERQTMQRRLEHLERVEEALRLLITEEQASSAGQLALITLPGTNGARRHILGNTPVSRSILESLGDGGVRPLAVLAQIAEAKGVAFDDKNPGRVLHFALIGLQRNGYAAKDERGWRLTDKALRLLKSNGDAPSEDQPEGKNTPSVAGL